MNRCFRITINEHGGAEPQRATTNLPYQESSGSSDPGGNISMPPPDGREVYPPPGGSDPSAGGSAGSTAACQPLPACSCACCCACECNCGAAAGSSQAGTNSSPTPTPGVTPSDYSGFVIVRLAEGVVGLSPAENLWTLAKIHLPELTELEAVLELPIGAGTASPHASASAERAITADAAAPPIVPLALPLPQPPPGALVSRPLVELRNPDSR